ncbi:MAG TPA: pyridoxal-phosphate dependent enzyme, partial [Vicinamibacterales bacterium]|nr:pyridoxal-phosphate dependent enzyme [Vicinamibacterales bacterium]
MTPLEAAAQVVYRSMMPTTQQRWPLLDARAGTAVWVKHENHTPVGAFKVRGGLVYFDDLARTPAGVKGVVAATRGNHGQSVAFAAARYGIPVAVVVPHGNSLSKNRAMRLIEVTDDEVEEAMRAIYDDTHNVAEGAAAAGLAALMQENDRLRGRV